MGSAARAKVLSSDVWACGFDKYMEVAVGDPNVKEQSAGYSDSIWS
jgi:hypothetical protein